MSRMWTFVVALGLAAAPVMPVLAAGPGSEPTGENAKAGTAAANASTPAAKNNPGGARTSDMDKSDNRSSTEKEKK